MQALPKALDIVVAMLVVFAALRKTRILRNASSI